MPSIIRLSKKELNELIEVTEAAEGDATELKRLLAETIEGGGTFTDPKKCLDFDSGESPPIK